MKDDILYRQGYGCEYIPDSTKELLEFLNKIYPTNNPNYNMTDKEIMYKAGQRSVVEMLIYNYDMQNVAK